ncbi:MULTISPECIES: DoxX family membrane protein [Paenibacillus]|uniref:DoxX family membrane protein n=1 Tax=Paenibacillus TaxID=44249 RepID=UPI0022B89F3F|nr:DoxX family protein [Paenibacillus caseinilyticus]MCZ8518290.1 DoxX family protein [Paenibacillus caseinilyticus]
MNTFERFIKRSTTVAILLTLIRFYLGWKWLTSGWGKITGSKAFDASSFLKNAIANSTGAKPTVQGWWGSFIEAVALPNIKVINVLIPWGEFLVGLALLLGIFTVFAAWMGALMNFSFFLSGSISTIPQMLLCSFILIYAGQHAGRIGIDYLLYRYRRKAQGSVGPEQPAAPG